MLHSIRLQNFVCFDGYPYQIKFGKLNIFVGENNSGKSTIFNAINVVRQLSISPSNHPPWNTEYYNLHDPLSITYGKDTNLTTSIIIDGSNFSWSVTKKTKCKRIRS